MGSGARSRGPHRQTEVYLIHSCGALRGLDSHRSSEPVSEKGEEVGDMRPSDTADSGVRGERALGGWRVRVR